MHFYDGRLQPLLMHDLLSTAVDQMRTDLNLGAVIGAVFAMIFGKVKG